ncbi:hypothetical protein Vadar_020112 [Vaccinium darrowii]|uniref:Uncharacterized protein n=1 Tax=Vaccinium darrowii TaxID=229202 RepID=A0ACB7ZL43_9ERIC|nr:hypothetical protein Vadar_020112 [Vaccinium darrowii]
MADPFVEEDPLVPMVYFDSPAVEGSRPPQDFIRPALPGETLNNVSFTPCIKKNVLDEQRVLQALWKIFGSETSPSKTIDDDDERFMEILRMVDPELHVSIDHVGLKCLEFYEEEKAKRKRMLRYLDGQVSLSVDILHPAKPGKCGSDYLCLKAYFVDEDWELKHWILSFTRVGHQSDDSPHDVILKSLKDWGIENKIATVTVPNSSLYGETVAIVRDYIRGKKGLQLYGRIFGVYCCSDFVSILVQDANKVISDIVDKIASVYDFGEPQPSWYLKNNKIKEALILESAGEFSYRYRGSWYDKPSKKEWEKVGLINRLVDDIYHIMFQLVEIGYSTSNVYLHHLQELQAYLMRESTSSNKFLSSVIEKVLETFGNYMKEMYLVLAIASVIDPRYKMKYLEFSAQKFGSTDSNSRAAAVLDAVRNLYHDYVKLESDSNYSSNLLREYTQFFEYTTNQLNSELDLYLEEPVIEWSKDFNALSWWKASSSKYPNVSKMARDILAIPVSCSGEFYFHSIRTFW